MRKIMAVFKKQIKDTLKNKTILIQFIMFPLLALVMTTAIPESQLPKSYFINLFATMFIGMAPLVSVAAIIAEEKEKHTLKCLIMANVKGYEYLLGIGLYVFCLCTLGIVIFGLLGGYTGAAFWSFIIALELGAVCSVLVGSAIGMIGKNQMSATSITVPVMMVFAFVPMLSMFNDTVEKIGAVLYTQQINILTAAQSFNSYSIEHLGIIFANMAVFIAFFIVIYKKKGIRL